MEFNFVFDKTKDNTAVANLIDEPNIVPLRLLLYLRDHGVKINVFSLEYFPKDSWYPIGISFYNFGIDYFNLLSKEVKEFIKQKKLKILFYYHEGDNPLVIKKDLDRKCNRADLPLGCYRFVSGNTQAEVVPNFCYFPDHELYFRRVSGKNLPLAWHSDTRQKNFTILSRTHKWWKATVMADLKQLHILDNAYWSYGNIDCGDLVKDNPIEVSKIPFLEQTINNFLFNAPYYCDQLSSDQHNQHSTLVPEHYNNSYLNIVLETFFDVDGSSGAFLTEKIFKPIRHAQPFVVVGAPGTLKCLRRLGYKTFDSVIDTSYDSEYNNTNRWLKLRQLLTDLKNKNLRDIFMACKDDVLHNQSLFLDSKLQRISKFHDTLN